MRRKPICISTHVLFRQCTDNSEKPESSQMTKRSLANCLGSRVESHRSEVRKSTSRVNSRRRSGPKVEFEGRFDFDPRLGIWSLDLDFLTLEL